ncbi:hypothetical protein [Marinoscillum sp. MHG1-6]|uniref:hypothetical protein n=1 Tax=Marinoscillum sp. MHG1-6 TaxID=2959627 RepID=UPI0021572199|nr:hypothetical protein [Marinoscillum sp. MHG1-6]
MKKFLLLAAIFFGLHQCLEAQTHAVYGELAGQSILYSINYELQPFTSPNVIPFGRIGFEYIPSISFDDYVESPRLMLPIEVGGFLGKANHFFEFSASVLIVNEKFAYESNFYRSYYWFGRIGYRYQKRDGGFLIRAGFTPIFAYKEEYSQLQPNWVPFGGICLGYVW